MLFRSEEGQTMAEYALILGLVMLVALVGLTSAAEHVVRIYDGIKALWL